jgi:hypothetical protein
MRHGRRWWPYLALTLAAPLGLTRLARLAGGPLAELGGAPPPSAMPSAKAYIGTRVVLIDGQRLSELMIKYGVGVQQRQMSTVVEVDEDY